MERRKTANSSILVSLNEAKSLDEVVIQCHRMNSSKVTELENCDEILKILAEHFENAESGRHQSELMKTIGKLDDAELQLTRKLLESRSSSEIVRRLLLVCASISRLQKHKDTILNNDDVQFLVDEFLQIGYKTELHLLDVFADCLSELCRQRCMKLEKPNEIFQLIVDNFDIPNQQINAALMNLFKNFIQWSKEIEDENVLCETISTILRMSWCSKMKYILLASVASIDMDLIRNNPHFKNANLHYGLEFSLKFSHLLSSSQTLFAAFIKDSYLQESLSAHLAGLIWRKDHKTVENIIKHRLSACNEDFRKKIAIILQKEIIEIDANISITSTKFNLILRLKTVFKSHVQCPNVENLAKNFSCTGMDCSEKLIYLQYFMEMSVNHKCEDQRIEFIFLLLNFVRYNMNEDDSRFIDCFIKTFPRLLCVIEAKKSSMRVEVLAEIFGLLKIEIINNGFKFGSYETNSFSLKTLRLILQHYFSAKNAPLGEHLVKHKIFDKKDYLTTLLIMIEDEDDSDLGEICVELIKEFYIDEHIRTIVKHLLWTPVTPTRKPEFNDESEVSEKVFKRLSSHEALRIEVLKHEGKNVKALKVSLDDLSSSVNGLRENVQKILSDELNRTNPLFERLSSLTYLLKISSSCDHLVLIEICKLFCNTVDIVLTLLNESDSPMTFEILNDQIQHLKIICSTDHSKNVVLNFMFYTLRACSEFSSMLADNWLDELDANNVDTLETVVTLTVEMNIKILTRCCHKGAIEAAKEAIGKLTRYISTKYKTHKINQHHENYERLLLLFRKKLNYDYQKVKDIRAARGLMFMIHEIISNHPAFIDIFVNDILKDSNEFVSTIHPIQLHILARIIKDSKTTSNIMTSYEKILFATMKLFRKTNEYVLCNGLLQILGSLVPKISIQKRHMITDEQSEILNDEYEYKDISVRSFITRFRNVFNAAKNDLLMESRSIGSLPSTYIVVIFQILTAFENTYPSSQDVDEILEILFKLMDHRCEKIRMLSAKCVSLWIPDKKESMEIIKSKIDNLFSKNENLLIACTRFLTLAILRMTHSTVIEGESLKSDMMEIIRFETSRYCNLGAISFYCRCYVLDFLLFLSFKKDDEIIVRLQCFQGVNDLYGFDLWREKIQAIGS